MATSSSKLSELTRDEINHLKQSLHVPQSGQSTTMEARLLTVQEECVQLLESASVRKAHIRFVIPRQGIKSDESIIDKINSQRRDKGKDLSLSALNDLIGAKVLCPYPTDVEEVLDWLYEDDRPFRVFPSREKAKQEREEKERDRGYRSYNLTLQLTVSHCTQRNLPVGAQNDKFELQVKTLLEEAWDAKTHDVTYKGPSEIDRNLRDHMKLVSKSLVALDEQTEVLRQQIMEEKWEKEQRKRNAALLFVCMNLTPEERNKIAVPDEDPSLWTEDSIQRMNIQLEGLTGDFDRAKALGHTLLAIIADDPRHSEEALLTINTLVSKNVKDPNWLRLRACIRWSLGYVKSAMDDLLDCIAMAEASLSTKSDDTMDAKNDFLYYACDLQTLSYEFAKHAQEIAAEIEQHLEGLQNEELSAVAELYDTLGRYYIVFATKLASVDKGREFLDKALNLSTVDEERHAVARAFHWMHLYEAVKQMGRFVQRTPLPATNEPHL